MQCKSLKQPLYFNRTAKEIDLIFLFGFAFKVKVLYARNLLLSTTEDTIEQVFSKFGEVERVKKIKDYSFIHFRTKEQARTALEAMNGNKIFMFMFCGSINFNRYREGFFELVNAVPAVCQRKPASFCNQNQLCFCFLLLK